MANVTETPSYDAGIYQIETTDPVLGGPNGIANAQAKGLANRTAFLKQQIDQLNSGQLTPAWIASQDYVQEQLQKLDSKQSVRAATTANITLSGVQTIDGVALTVGDRVLVKDQTAAAQNGIYLVAAQSWTRATDADNGTKLSSGARVAVEEGAVNAGKVWYLSTTGSISIGTAALLFSDEHPDATESVKGRVKIASQEQMDGGTDDNSAATPKKLAEHYKRKNILGVVSQVAGVPTGAIIERGLNANGQYIKYADGTLICHWQSANPLVCDTQPSPGSPLYASSEISFTFPAAFVLAPDIVYGCKSTVLANGYMWGGSSLCTATQMKMRLFTTYNSAPSAYASYIAIGKWF